LAWFLPEFIATRCDRPPARCTAVPRTRWGLWAAGPPPWP